MEKLYDDFCSLEGGLKPSTFAVCQCLLADGDAQEHWGLRNRIFWVITHWCYFCNNPEEYFPAAFSNAGLYLIPEQKQTT